MTSPRPQTSSEWNFKIGQRGASWLPLLNRMESKEFCVFHWFRKSRKQLWGVWFPNCASLISGLDPIMLLFFWFREVRLVARNNTTKTKRGTWRFFCTLVGGRALGKEPRPWNPPVIGMLNNSEIPISSPKMPKICLFTVPSLRNTEFLALSERSRLRIGSS